MVTLPKIPYVVKSEDSDHTNLGNNGQMKQQRIHCKIGFSFVFLTFVLGHEKSL